LLTIPGNTNNSFKKARMPNSISNTNFEINDFGTKKSSFVKFQMNNSDQNFFQKGGFGGNLKLSDVE